MTIAVLTSSDEGRNSKSATSELLHDKMEREASLQYILVGSAVAGEKGCWRWSIFSGLKDKPVETGSFYGPLPGAKEYVEAALWRLKNKSEQ